MKNTQSDFYKELKEERRKFFVAQGFLLSEESLDRLFSQSIDDTKVTFWKNNNLSHIQKIITVK